MIGMQMRVICSLTVKQISTIPRYALSMRPLNGPDGASAPASAADRRHNTRRSAMWAAQLETARGERVSCIVLDVSAAGVRIQLEHSIAKDDIVLLITARVGAHWCRVAWLDGVRVGLEFLESHTEAPTSSSSGVDAKFLRGRAGVLRRLALTATSLEAAGKLIQSAREFEQAATALEQQQPTPSIRKGH
ncbi:MAG TPA: PilZ domain-containing protein [Stellaceae bacterium]|jgi:hypothetical protein|nr:PilZ domain-containing protein [Stellaceae bacterium]